MVLTFLLPPDPRDEAGNFPQRVTCRMWKATKFWPQRKPILRKWWVFFTLSVPLCPPTGLRADVAPRVLVTPLVWGYYVSLMHTNLFIWVNVFSGAGPFDLCRESSQYPMRGLGSRYPHSLNHAPDYVEAEKGPEWEQKNSEVFSIQAWLLLHEVMIEKN